MNNQVTCFMYYMYNSWNINEAKRVFGDNLGEHIYNKWCNRRMDNLYWYSELDSGCREKIVNRACELYENDV